jgi:RHS repeat-associated protein
LAAEYSTAAAVDAGTTYLTADHLGSTRLVTDGSQKPVHRFDYMPFGQDLSAYGNRNLVASYRALGVPAQEFTGKERDVETGLDYFGARYFSAAQGRFTSPDPIHIMPQKLLDPQQWNMFAYVRNNPLRLVDPTGMYVCNASKNECKAFEKARQKDLKSKNSAVHNAAVGYGDAGKDNGVTVRFGDPGDGNNGNTTTQLKYYQKTNTWQAAADVVIKTGLSGNALQATVGHEGVHIENAQDFVSTITSDFHYDLSKNLTHWQTEMNAYAVTAAIDPGHSYGTCGSGPCAPAQGMSAQAVAITTMIRLANPANGYNRFVDVGNGTMVGVLGMRQFADITTPNPPKQ